MFTSPKKQKHAEEPALFLVTTSLATGKKASGSDKNVRREVWDASRPYPIGFPFRWALEKTNDGIRVRTLEGKPGEPVAEGFIDLTSDQQGGNRPILLTSNGNGPDDDLDELMEGDSRAVCLYIAPIAGIPKTPLLASASPEPVSVIAFPTLSEDRLFKGLTLLALAGLALFYGALRMIPVEKPSTEELIPPQFAKILLSPALKEEVKKLESSHAEARASNVVRAFKSEAVKKSVRSVLNVGALSALTHSGLMGGGGPSSALDGVFGKQGKNPLAGLSALTGKALDLGSSSGNVGLVGANGGLGGGKGTGYGTGVGAGVGGAGKGLVNLVPDGVTTEEGLTKEEIGRVIHAHVGEVRFCYESALSRDPSLDGKMLVAFTVSGTGTVKTASASEATTDDGLNKCILDHLLKWKFPKPKGGVEVSVTYPFIFKSMGL